MHDFQCCFVYSTYLLKTQFLVTILKYELPGNNLKQQVSLLLNYIFASPF